MPRKTKSDKYIVYKHTNTANGKVYIGITSTDIETLSGINGKNYANNTLFNKAIKKYGWQAFAHDVLLDNLSLKEATDAERMFIQMYNSTNPAYGYNLSSGGEGGNTGCSISDEERTNRSNRVRGKNNPQFGKFGAEHPAFGCKHSEESKNAVSEALLGRMYSNETLKRMRDAARSRGAWVGNKNPMSGKKYGDAPQSRAVVCVETGELFDSVKRAAVSLGVAPTNITNVCNGRQRTSCGFHWRYAAGEVGQDAS